jgi:hypothetical protein
MPEDVTRDLTAFTPAGLDRDAVLFAAGRAAARRWAGWKWLAIGLVVTNAVTLGGLLWPRPTVDPSTPVVSPDQPPAEPPPAFTPEPYSYLALRHDAARPAAFDPGPSAPAEPLTPRAINEFRIP